MKVMFVVTHLLGSGHLARASTIGRAFVSAGHSVRIVTGGLPTPHLDTGDLDFCQLPPLRSDGANFGRLLDADGRLVNEAYLESRRDVLVSHLRSFKPDVLITELFPFGRRMLSNEFLALLEAADNLDPRPIICASIRDILDPPSKPSRAEETCERIKKYYDAILVHSDPKIVALDKSWPLTTELSAKLHYTGFVARPAARPHPDALGTNEIIVSAGGGNTGQDLFTSALDAARAWPDRTWRLLVGGSDVGKRCGELSSRAPSNAIVEPARPDFRQMLHHAEISVSMCGYNTTLDLLQAGVRSVCVPLDDGNEVEQSLRAEALAKLDGFEILPSRALSAESLLQAIKNVRATPVRPPLKHGLRGSEHSVEITEKLFRERSNAG